jgi:hypothetical protein
MSSGRKGLCSWCPGRAGILPRQVCAQLCAQLCDLCTSFHLSGERPARVAVLGGVGSLGPARVAVLGGVGSLGSGKEVVGECYIPPLPKNQVSSHRPLPRLLREGMPIAGQHTDGRAVLHRR